MLPLKRLGEIRFKERKKTVFILYKLLYTNPKPVQVTESHTQVKVQISNQKMTLVEVEVTV